MATYPYAFGCGPDPKKPIDKYWNYKNKDPSTAYYGTIVVNEIFSGMHERISKRGYDIYEVRPDAIIVQDLRYEAVRQLIQILNRYIRVIERHEQENSGDISNYLDSEKEEKEQNEGNEQKEGSD